MLVLLIRATQRAEGGDTGATLEDIAFFERLNAVGAKSIAEATPEQLAKAFEG